jgi:hypothetical protein
MSDAIIDATRANDDGGDPVRLAPSSVDAGSRDVGSEATRRLCAAVHLDRQLRWEILDWLAGAEYRAIGVSPGVDLVTVARHALHASQRALRRDRTLAAIIAAALLGALLTPLTLIVGALACWGIVVRERWVARYRVVGQHLREHFNPDVADPSLTSFWERRLDELRQAQRGNVTVFSGFSPFRGSGSVIGGWSFSLSLERGKDRDTHRREPQEVQVADLYDFVTDRLDRLEIENLRVTDRLLVDGLGIRKDERFLDEPASQPRPAATTDVIAQLRERPERAVRYYTCVRVVDWDGELVLSIFLRLRKIAKSLFAEANYVLLTPLGSRIRRVDDFAATPVPRDVAHLVSEATVAAPGICAFAPFRAFSWLHRGQPGHRAQRRMVERQPAWDYGAPTAIRERLAADRYQQYFQWLDEQMYVKLIEREILAAIGDFLDAKGIDTSELREQRSTILNAGVVISGDVNAQSVAVGSGARASVVDMARKQAA